MTLTTSTLRHTLQWRGFIGPPYLPAGHASHWDWSALNVDAAYTPVAESHIVNNNLGAADTTVLMTTGTVFPETGGVWIGPGAAGQSWEYCLYTSRSGAALNGLVRGTVDAESNNLHAIGATVRFWWPVDTCDGVLQFTERMTDNLAAVGWSAEIRGHKIPQAALRTGHLVLIQIREATTSAWGSWVNALVGWIINPKARDTTGGQSWSIQVAGLDGVLSQIQSRGVRVGRPNLAAAGSVGSSTALSKWYKEAGRELQRQDDATADMTLDSDPVTRYISERYLGTNNAPADGRLDQIHIAPYVGQSRGYRRIQYSMSNAGVGFRFFNQEGVYPGTDASGIIHLTAGLGVPVVVCENEQLFKAENPEYGDAQFFEVSTNAFNSFQNAPGGYDANDWWDSLAPSGGAICVQDTGNNITAKVIWGSVTAVYAEANWPGGTAWSGAVIPALHAGETIRRMHASGAFDAAGYAVSLTSTPGYYIEGTLSGIGDERQFLLYRAPSLGLQLTDAITAGSPATTGALNISSADGPTTDGLDASGTIQVGLEQITYTGKSADNKSITGITRGANSTTAAAHSQGTAVYAVTGGEATDARPVHSVTWERATGEPYPVNFVLLASKYDVVRTPDEDPNFALDYDTLETVVGHAAVTWTHVLATPTRYRYIMLLVSKMSVDPYRLVVNRFRINGDSAVYSSASYVVGGTVADVAEKVLNYAGVPANAQLVASGGDNTPSDDDHTTAPDNAWSVLSDLADFTGCRVTVNRDSKIRTESDPFWAMGATLPSEVTNWTKVIAAAFEIDWQSGRNVGQVSIEWRQPDGTVITDPVKYPATQDHFGSVVNIGPLVYANIAAAQAAAQKRYWMLRRPIGMLVEAAGAPWATRAGQADGILWQLDSEMLAIDRTCLVRSVDHQISDHLTTVVHLLQISREDER